MDKSLEERPEFQLEQEVLRWADAVYQEADSDLMSSPESKQVQRIIDFLEGKQWSAKARGRSRPVVNRVIRNFVEMTSLLTDIQPDIKVKFTDDIEGFSEMEKLMNQILLDWAYMSDFEQELTQIVMYGLISDGPAKVQWNPFLRGGMGDVEIQNLSPLNFMQIGAASKLQSEAEVCIMRNVVTKAWLVRKFGEVAEGVKADVDIEATASPQRPRWNEQPPLDEP